MEFQMSSFIPQNFKVKAHKWDSFKDLTFSITNFRRSKPLNGGFRKPTSFLSIIWIFILLSVQETAQAQTISLTKSASTLTPNVGVPFKYTINYANPSITLNLLNGVIRDTVPQELQFVTGSIATSNPAHIASTNYNSTTHVITITFVTPLAAGSTGTIEFSAGFPSGTYTGSTADNTAYGTSGAGSSLSNTVTVTAANGSPAPVYSNNLYVDKTGPTTAGIGGGVSYGIRVGNYSINDATNVVVYDTIPAAINLKYIVTCKFPFTMHPYSIYYQLNGSPGVWNLLGTYNTSANSYITLSDLSIPPAGQWVTMIKIDLGTLSGNGDFYPNKPNSSGFTLAGEVLNPDHNGNPTDGKTITNCASISGVISAVNIVRRDCVSTALSIQPIMLGASGKLLTNGQIGYVPGDIVSWHLWEQNSNQNTMDWSQPVVTDLLPPELEFIGNVSISYPNGYAPLMGTPVFTQIDNYNNTGQTLLRWSWPGYFPKNLSSYTMHIYFDTKVRMGTFTGTYSNVAYQGGGTAYTGCGSATTSVVDVNDLDGDSNTTEVICSSKLNFNVVLPSAAGLESVKWVKGALDTAYSKYPAHGNTTPGGLADYKLIVRNPGTVSMTNIVIVDILPFIGDHGVIDTSARLTQWRPFLIAPISAPSGTTVYYSTAQNPCRPELNTTVSGCVAPNWSTTPPADITSVQSIKIDFGSMVMAPGASYELNWPMRAPVDAPSSGEIAWNSFGYIGTRADNNVQLLASEPIKVGISIEPIQPAVYGNWVWFDTNGNGLQDATETAGVNGMTVQLYEDLNGNNLAEPGGADGAPISYTLTASNGYYLFPSLQPGNYFAVFSGIPSGYFVSPAHIGMNDAIDSDGTLSGSVWVTPVTNLTALEDDRTWDLGITNTTPCSITVNSAAPSACDPAMNTYSLDVTVTYSGAPSGNIIIKTSSGGYISVPTTTSPQVISLTGLLSNGDANIDVVAYFSSDLTCTDTLLDAYTAPVNCQCNTQTTVLVGDLLTAGGGEMHTFVYDPTMPTECTNPPLPGGEGIVYDAMNQVIYFVDATASKIRKYDIATQTYTDLTTSNPCWSYDLALSPDGLYLYATCTSQIYRISTATGAVVNTRTETAFPGDNNLWGVDVNPLTGEVYVTRGFNGSSPVTTTSISKVGADLSGTVTPIGSVVSDGSVYVGLRFAKDGTFWVVRDGKGVVPDAVLRYAADGTLISTQTWSPPLVANSEPVDLDFGPDGDLYVTTWLNYCVIKYDFATDTWSEYIPAVAGSNGKTLAFACGLVNCVCTQPSAIALTITQPNCTGGTAANNGSIVLSAITDADKFGVSTGSTYSGTPDYAGATAIGALPQDLQTAIPNTGGTYTIRFFNGSDACYKDSTVIFISVPMPDLLARDTLICGGNSIDLSTLFTQDATVGTITYYQTYADATAEMNAIAATETPASTTEYFIRKETAVGCADIDSVDVTVSQLVSAGTGTNPADICAAASGLPTVDLFGQLVGETAGGTWTQTSGTSVGAKLNATAGTLDPNGLAADTYVFLYTVTGTSPCPNDTESITVTITDCTVPCPPVICVPVSVVKQ